MVGRTRVIIMGAAGRDFHNFNVHFRERPDYEVVAFTAAQIPEIENRSYPPELAGPLYPQGIPIRAEEALQELIRAHQADQVVFAYSDLSHEAVMYRASLVLAAGPDFRLMGPNSTMLEARVPVVAVCAVRTGSGKSPATRHIARLMGRESARTLKVAGSVLRACGFDEMISLVKFFQPSVLLLDDLELGNEQRTEEFLTILEALRAPDCLVIVTMMTPTDQKKKPKMGDYHFGGMRPGRIDEVFTFFLPDADDRDAILQYYYSQMDVPNVAANTQKAIVRATSGLSGAYLGEVARRIKIHGIKEWRAEVENVRLAAPDPSAESEGTGNKAVSGGDMPEKSAEG